MELKQLLESLVDHYQVVISKVKKLVSMDDIQDILFSTNTYHGVCHCATYTFKTDIYSSKWVTDLIPIGSSYWYPPLNTATNKEEVLDRLETRVEILKKELHETT